MRTAMSICTRVFFLAISENAENDEQMKSILLYYSDMTIAV